jgi:hypothetical protein
MAYTINLDGESISKEELDLLKIKQAILEKLRVRFGEPANQNSRDTAHLRRAEPRPAPRQ